MARTPNERKNVTMSVTMPRNVFDAVEDVRWSQRLKVSEFVTDAVREKLAALGVTIADTDEATDEANTKTSK